MNIRSLAIIALLTAVSPLAWVQDTIHVLRKGETLYAIARTYGVSTESILKANEIDDARKLQIGQKIRIPQGSEQTKHKVLKGETLFGIARQYGVSLSTLREANGLTESSVIKIGQTLVVPVAPSTVAETKSSTTEKVTPPPSVSPGATPQSDPRPTKAKTTNPKISWPIQAKDIVYMTGKLYGVVITGERAETVRSLSDGTVVSAGPYRGFGRVAIVQTADGHAYVYGGCETLLVKEGDKVASGAALGELGVDSLSRKPQLYFLVYKDNKAIDPAIAPRS